MTDSLSPSERKNDRDFFLWAAGAFILVFALVWLAAGHPSPGGPAPTITAGFFLATFAAATVVLLVLVRAMRSPVTVVMLMRVSLTVGVALLAWRLGGEGAAVLSLPLTVLLAFGYARVWAVDAAVIAAAAGIAVEVGTSMNPLGVAIILALLSVYDVIAVFGTRHMVYLGERLAADRAVFALVIPLQKNAWTAPFASVGPAGGRDGTAAKRAFSFLGIGDLVLPTLLVAAALTRSFFAAGLTALGILGGVAALAFWLLPRRRGGMLPALPPLALGAVIGFGIGYLI